MIYYVQNATVKSAHLITYLFSYILYISMKSTFIELDKYNITETKLLYSSGLTRPTWW